MNNPLPTSSSTTSLSSDINSNCSSTSTQNNATTLTTNTRTNRLSRGRKRKADEAGLSEDGADIINSLDDSNNETLVGTGIMSRRAVSNPSPSGAGAKNSRPDKAKSTKENKEKPKAEKACESSDKKSKGGRSTRKEKESSLQQEKNEEEEEGKNECIICMENMKEEATLDTCRHVFCYDCIVKWSKTENTCPLCKARFHKIVCKNPVGTTPTGRKKRQKTERVTDRNQRNGPNFADFLNDIAAMEGELGMFMGMGMAMGGPLEAMGLFRELTSARNRRGNRRNNDDNNNNNNGPRSRTLIIQRREPPNSRNSNDQNPAPDPDGFRAAHPIDFIQMLMHTGMPTPNRNPGSGRRLQGTREFALRQSNSTSRETGAHSNRSDRNMLDPSHVRIPPIALDTDSITPSTRDPSPPITIDLQPERITRDTFGGALGMQQPMHIPPMDRLVSFSNSLNRDGRTNQTPPVIEIIDNDDEDVEIINVIRPQSIDP